MPGRMLVLLPLAVVQLPITLRADAQLDQRLPRWLGSGLGLGLGPGSG